MANRHLARSVVLQVLFERDAAEGKLTPEQALSRLADYGKEFGTRDSDMPFMKDLLQTAVAKQKEIDEVIVRAAPEWPIETVPVRATLDSMYSPDVQRRVQERWKTLGLKTGGGW